MTKIVNSLLAIAASSSVLLAQGGGWTGGPGKGLKFDGGDAFSMKMDGQLQTHWTYTGGDVNPDVSNFNVRRARLAFTGHAYKKSIRYVLRLDGVDDGIPIAGFANGPLKDGHVTWDFMEGENGSIGLRMGQGKTQFGLEGTGSSKGLFFVERSSAARGFSDARSTGAWVMGSHRENSLRWSFGAMNGATAAGLGAGYVDFGEEAANSDNELSYVATVSFDPMGDNLGGKGNESFRQGDFRSEDKALRGTIGAGLGLENGVSGATGTDVDTTSVNINTVWSVNGFQAMGEVFLRTDDQQGAGTPDEEEATGWAISGTYVLPKSGDSTIQWGFGARINMVETDTGNNGAVNFLTGLNGIGGVNGDATEISLVANAFYHGHAAKTQFEYTLQQVSPTGGADLDNHIIRVAFQILF